MLNRLYSKKVLEYFQHPKNLGVIKNADGVGTVGNPACGDVMRVYIKVKSEKVKGKIVERIKDIKVETLGCLPKNEDVVLPQGSWLNIASIIKNSRVLNSIGKSTKVVKTFKRNYRGFLLKIIPFVSPFNTFSLTPDHPILCIKRKWLPKSRISNRRCDLLRINQQELISFQPEYISAGQIERGDYLAFVPNLQVRDNRTFNEKIMRLIGYYLAEGFVTAQDTVINFSFNKNEKEAILETKKLCREILGKIGSERTRGNITELRICSAKWAKFFIRVAGKLARNKSLSDEIMLLPFKKQWEMIKTYHIGNGDVYRRRTRDSKTYRIITASRNLAIQIQEILARGKIFASIREIFKTDCEIEGRKLKNSIQWLITFKLDRKHHFVHKNDKYFLIPVRKIEKIKFSGPVYNFQVASEPNSYLVRGFAVHNCGAAIATSSMATEMVKGKTLDEALKLTNKAVAEALEGLPPIKMHCSVLAEQGIKAAIEDYQKKSKVKKKK